MFEYDIISPNHFGIHREAEAITLRVELRLRPVDIAPRAVRIKIGQRTILCEIRSFVGANGGTVYYAEHHYRAGFGLKKISFSASLVDGKEKILGSRYVFVRTESVGPAVSIPFNAKNRPSGINVIGSLCYEFGLGEAARGHVRAVEHADIPARRVLAPLVRNCSKVKDFDYGAVDRRLEFYVNLLHLNAPDMLPLRGRWPRIFKNGQYNVGYWFFELGRLPDTWLEGFKGLSEVWVSSRFVYDAVKAISPIPVYMVPPLVAVDAPACVHQSEFGIPEELVSVLSVFDLNSYRERKNPEAAIRAFELAYRQNPKLHLVLKVNNADKDILGMEILKGRLSGLTCVTLITEVMSREKLTRLQAACDMFISLHRAEGFGLNLAECMALGKPIIATNWSANIDYMNNENSCPVDFELIEIQESVGPYEKGQIWANPCVDHAATHIINLAKDDQLRRAMGEKAKQTIQDHYSLPAVAKAIAARYDAIVASRSMRSA